MALAIRLITAGTLTIVVALALAACDRSPITSNRIEPAIETTFANLVELQVARLRLPPIRRPDVAVTAICRKQVAGSNSGAGEWTCTIVWQGPGRKRLRDTYELIVNTDGCYSATISGESLGGPVLITPDGRTVKNLLYA